MINLSVNLSVIISVIIVNWNTKELLADCINSIDCAGSAMGDVAHNPSIEIIVVDNASTDGSPLMLREKFPQVKLIQNSQNVGFARANNQGLAAAQGQYLLLLNSDTLVPAQVLDQAIQWMEQRPSAGLVGAKLVNPDGSFQASYAAFPTLRSEFLVATGLGRRCISPFYPSPRPHPNEAAREVDWVAGAFMLIRRDAYAQIGGMSDHYHMYSEETDWCFRIRKGGWQVHYLPELHIVHLGGASTRQRRAEMVAQLNRSKIQFFAANYGSTRAAQLRMLLTVIFSVRQLGSRVLSFVLPKPSAERWRVRSDTEKLVRDTCLQFNS